MMLLAKKQTISLLLIALAALCLTGGGCNATEDITEVDTAVMDAKADRSISGQFCIFFKCFSEMIACNGDDDCKQQLDCINGCADVADDHDAYNRCTLRCNLLLVPPSPLYEDLMACVLLNGCGPEQPNECSLIENTSVLHDLTPDQLEGQWFNVKGYNSGTDCFDCSYSTFTMGDYPEESRKTFWRIDWLMDDLGMRYIEGELEVGGFDHPGVAVFTYPHVGVEFVEYYNMVYYNDEAGHEVLVFVGCGGSDTSSSHVGYSIGMVLTRQQVSELPADVEAGINEALIEAELLPPLEPASVADWCWNSYDDCPAR